MYIKINVFGVINLITQQFGDYRPIIHGKFVQ
jgi:hypothetical protein